MVSLPTLGTLPLIGRPLRNQLMAPVVRSLAADRLPFEQYTDPPGDPGLFGPGSVTWRVHADPSMLVGGLAALMLQTLHPLAIAGVEEHSNYRDDPLGRLSRTGSFVTGTTFGSTEAAERLIKLVRGIHRKVHGTAPDGRPYSADDPHLVTWVHVTEVSSFLRAHQRFTPFPVRGDQADRYFHETAVIAERLGGEGIPRSRLAVRAYFRHIRPDLEAGEQALGAIEFLAKPMRGRGANPVMTAAHQVVIQAAIGLLPPWARDMLGLPQPGLVGQAVVLPAAHLLLGGLRFAGGEPLALIEARRRCAAEPISA
ncbi:MAG TPA: oxygenase MpaB family protein [Acidimicrobiales bacterium]|jgi:uncharacterized protein (DUF2236 family)|nr:oxygenase MpaB family protein [Acidimicrobiales bacterium]